MSPSGRGRLSVYLRHSVLPVDEDQTHELKGHRSIAQEEVNPRNHYRGTDGKEKWTRQSVSKYLCGMLNSGKGGTVYCGVLDDGRVEGFMLTASQRDHVMLSLRDTFDRYRPRVPGHMYNVRFVPIVDSMDEKVNVRKSGDNPELNADLPHVLRTHRHCWCDDECLAMMGRGMLSQFFVLEVTIHPWDPKDPRNKSFIQSAKYPQLNPLFVSEDGKGYVRRNASNECFAGGVDDVRAVTREQMAALGIAVQNAE